MSPLLTLQGYGRKKFVFQGVHETICYGPADKDWEEGEPCINQIVFIGRGLDRKVCKIRMVTPIQASPVVSCASSACMGGG